jgi:hypothetical protein
MDQATSPTGHAGVQEHRGTISGDEDAARGDISVDDVQWLALTVDELVGETESSQNVEAQAAHQA